jgi:hypothetical protein
MVNHVIDIPTSPILESKENWKIETAWREHAVTALEVSQEIALIENNYKTKSKQSRVLEIARKVSAGCILAGRAGMLCGVQLAGGACFIGAVAVVAPPLLVVAKFGLIGSIALAASSLALLIVATPIYLIAESILRPRGDSLKEEVLEKVIHHHRLTLDFESLEQNFREMVAYGRVPKEVLIVIQNQRKHYHQARNQYIAEVKEIYAKYRQLQMTYSEKRKNLEEEYLRQKRQLDVKDSNYQQNQGKLEQEYRANQIKAKSEYDTQLRELETRFQNAGKNFGETKDKILEKIAESYTAKIDEEIAEEYKKSLDPNLTLAGFLRDQRKAMWDELRINPFGAVNE